MPSAIVVTTLAASLNWNNPRSPRSRQEHWRDKAARGEGSERYYDNKRLLLNAARRKEASVSRCASRVCKLSIATPNARRIIGRNIKLNVSCVPPSFAMKQDEALFKDPPPKEECPICFLPMPNKLICCVSLPPATITSVPIND